MSEPITPTAPIDERLGVLLSEGGDARIVIDPATRRNQYMSSPWPVATVAYASSTANDISADAYGHGLGRLAALAPDLALSAEGYAAALGNLRRILVRPTEAMRAAGPIYSSLNCWRFDTGIFDACRGVPPSARGELELPQAVQRALDSGMRMTAIPVAAPVLDMSSRRDIASVAARLRDVVVRL